MGRARTAQRVMGPPCRPEGRAGNSVVGPVLQRVLSSIPTSPNPSPALSTFLGPPRIP